MWHTRKKSSTGSYHRLPIVVPALMLGLRPVAKTVMKGGLFLTGSDWVAEVRGQVRSTTAPRGEGGVAKQPGAADLPGSMGTDSAFVEVAIDQPQQPEAADLQRLTGIDRKYAELLREAGVESVRARSTQPSKPA